MFYWRIIRPFKHLLAVLLLAWPATTVVTAAELPATKLFVDFEEATGIKMTPVQAESKLVRIDGNRVLQITTKAADSWPGVQIEPRAGKWDLAGFEAVKMDVVNPQDVAVRVLLSVKNPGSDGRKNCNTESVSVPANGRATLVLPFGSWHGETNHPIDQSNIVSVMIMLDRPGRLHEFTVDNIRATSLEEDMTEVVESAFFKQLVPVYGRGVNLGNALEAPKEGEWGVRLEEQYFDLIQQAGFDSVRIPTRWSSHAAHSAPYHIDEEFVDRVKWAVDNAIRRRLSAVLNTHHYDEIFSQPDQHRQRFLALWEQIAEQFKDYPPALSFELLNEPHDKLTADKWNNLLAEAITVIRQTNPTRKIVVGPVGWNAASELNTLQLPEDDRNLVVTFHYYSPFQFTHQGAGWAGRQSQQWLGTKWTGTAAEKAAVRRDLDTAIRWAVEHRRPVYLGEFGAYSRADMESRSRWTQFVADEAIRRKIGFAYWEFCAGFGVYDPDKKQWHEPLKKALLPGQQ